MKVGKKVLMCALALTVLLSVAVMVSACSNGGDKPGEDNWIQATSTALADGAFVYKDSAGNETIIGLNTNGTYYKSDKDGFYGGTYQITEKGDKIKIDDSVYALTYNSGSGLYTIVGYSVAGSQVDLAQKRDAEVSFKAEILYKFYDDDVDTGKSVFMLRSDYTYTFEEYDSVKSSDTTAYKVTMGAWTKKGSDYALVDNSGESARNMLFKPAEKKIIDGEDTINLAAKSPAEQTEAEKYGTPGNYKKLSVKNTYNYISKHPAFKVETDIEASADGQNQDYVRDYTGFGDYLSPFINDQPETKAKYHAREFRDVCTMILPSGTHLPSLMMGLNYLIERLNEDPDLYQLIYSEDEIHADGRRIHAGGFFFKGVEGAPTAFVIGGGGGQAVALTQEAFPVAMRLCETYGYNCFIPMYQVRGTVGSSNGNGDFVQLMKWLVPKVGTSKGQYNIDLTDYTVWGFSAGGGIAANWAGKAWKTVEGVEKPTAAMLAYSTGQVGASDSKEDWCPVVLVHCEDDTEVNIKGSINGKTNADAIDLECLFYKYATGGHGFGLGVSTSAEGWVDKAVDEMWQQHSAWRKSN